MKLSFDCLKTLMTGAVRYEERGKKLRPLRFSAEQERMYYAVDPSFGKKTLSTAGIKAEFFTNSKTLTVEVEAYPSSSRYFFDFDVTVNGELVESFGSTLKNEDNSIAKSKKLRHTTSLGEGEKRVAVFFPWSVAIDIISVEIDDGADIRPAPRKYKMLTFGDSITHGYDAKNPSKAYATALATALDADPCNKGIGGEVFRPSLAALCEDTTPDIITVAYGTNDWSKLSSIEEYKQNSEQFYTILSSLYPDARIIALAPIWRVDIEKETKLGDFSNIAKQIHAIAENIPNMQVIDCVDFLPKTPEIFSDLRIHPNDRGFEYYLKGILENL